MRDFILIESNGALVLVAPTRWYFIAGNTWPIEGIDANGDLHTIDMRKIHESVYEEVDAHASA
jgi:hypothetical protein